jgi:LPPG:FO 2-phospho-L-lactate transferase
MKIATLAGGVGGAKLVDGLAQVMNPGNLTVIANTGDDFEHFGLYICPDIDTILYTLAGVANRETGWGRADETWNALETLGALDGPVWFRLGDRDLGLHLERTRRLNAGEALSGIVADFCSALGVRVKLLPMSDDRVPTWVSTDEGELPFQEYFVQRRCEPAVSGFRFENADQASPAPGVIEGLQEADLVVICPSNPWVSIDPILSIPGVREAVAGRTVVAVSPIVSGKAIKGPAAKMYAELGIDPSASSVARHYNGLIDKIVIDNLDVGQAGAIKALGVQPLVTDIVMKTRPDRRRLAKQVLEIAGMVEKSQG